MQARDNVIRGILLVAKEMMLENNLKFHAVPKISLHKQTSSDKILSEERRVEDASTSNTMKPKFKDSLVPSTPIQRAIGFGSLFTGLAFGTVAEISRRATGFSEGSGSSWLSKANADRLASTLCRMRGAALKLGQMLSIQDETVLPPVLAAALDKVRAGADQMPEHQLNSVLTTAFGSKTWRQDFFTVFDETPIAAASLGQVHQAVTKTGNRVVIKVQYPGVAESIESDVSSLRTLAKMTGIFPKGLFIDSILDVVGSDLKEECDYLREAGHLKEFRNLLKNDVSFKVPYVVEELTTKSVLTMEQLTGIPLDKVADLSQATRDHVGRLLLRLTLRELFEFNYVQTDPNFANYLYDVNEKKICLLDFGATKQYDKKFVKNYAQLVWAAAERDRESLLKKSVEIGMLTGKENAEMVEAHVQAGFEIAEPFSRSITGSYDFSASNVSLRVARHGPVFMKHRLVPPPEEIYSLHRKLSGAYMACVKIRAKFPCRDLLQDAVRDLIVENELF